MTKQMKGQEGPTSVCTHPKKNRVGIHKWMQVEDDFLEQTHPQLPLGSERKYKWRHTCNRAKHFKVLN